MKLYDIITYIILGIFIIGGAYLSYIANRASKLDNNNDEQEK